MIQCVDLSKDEEPAFKSDILYSRIFGKGPHNIYQPTDEELKIIEKKASKEDHKTVAISFHPVKMFKDAARFKIYKQFSPFHKSTRENSILSFSSAPYRHSLG